MLRTCLSILIVGSTSMNTYANYVIPRDYTNLESSIGSQLIQNGKFHAITVDLSKSRLNFGNLSKSGYVKCWKNKKWDDEVDEEQKSNCEDYHYLFNKLDKSDHWNDYSSSNTFAFVNGQFFDHDISKSQSPISYITKANGVIYQSKNDSNRRAVYSLLQQSGKYYYKYGSSSILLNSYSDVFTTWNIFEEAASGELSNRDNRTYLGVIPKDSSCKNMKYPCEISHIIFMLAKNKTANEVINELLRFGITYNNISRLDSGGSAQYKTSGYDFGSGRNMPHMIEILDK